MKQLFFTFTLLFLFLSCSSQSEYITYIEGDDPIIILATHGGEKFTNKIKNRDCGKYTCVSDLNTNKLAKESEYYFYKQGLNPHILVMELDRKEIDLNRTIEEACNGLACNLVYNEYHNLIKTIINKHNKDKILILDLHGHSHSHALIELGYDISRSDYLKDILNITPSSLNSINTDDLNSVIRGIESFGTLFNAFEYKSTPSNLYPIPPKKYFNGGYITEYYSKYRNVVVIQLELPYYIRETNSSRYKFLNVFSKISKHYYDKVVNN